LRKLGIGLPSPAMGVAVAALFVALGGTGYAAGNLGGHSHRATTTKASSDKRADSAQISSFFNSHKASLVGPAGPAGPAGAKGATGASGPPGNTGPPGAPGTAKAYGYINANGTLDPTFSKNVTATSSGSAGEYCVTVSGASSSSEGAVAILDWSGDSTGGSTVDHVEWRSSSAGCSTGQFDFKTFDVTSGTVTQTAEPFFFIVP
jgi:hypothetical protein